MADMKVQPAAKQSRRAWRGWILGLAVLGGFIIVGAVVLLWGIGTQTERIRVESISMQPTLSRGDFVIVNKLAYRFGQPQRQDIIAFYYPPNPEEEPYIKRIIGLPGDQVRIANLQVYINGKLLDESYLGAPTNRGGEWTVPDGQLFVMGDNRNNSSDSRAWGFVPLELVIGRAESVYWPREHARTLRFTAPATQP
jgi:signal peptidase I